MNQREMAALKAPPVSFAARDRTEVATTVPVDKQLDAERRLLGADFWRDCQAAATITLKVCACVDGGCVGATAVARTA